MTPLKKLFKIFFLLPTLLFKLKNVELTVKFLFITTSAAALKHVLIDVDIF